MGPPFSVFHKILLNLSLFLCASVYSDTANAIKALLLSLQLFLVRQSINAYLQMPSLSTIEAWNLYWDPPRLLMDWWSQSSSTNVNATLLLLVLQKACNSNSYILHSMYEHTCEIAWRHRQPWRATLIRGHIGVLPWSSCQWENFYHNVLVHWYFDPDHYFVLKFSTACDVHIEREGEI